MKKYAFFAIFVIAVSLISCGGNTQSCTNCDSDTLGVKDTLNPMDPPKGIDTPLSPVDSAGVPKIQASL